MVQFPHGIAGWTTFAFGLLLVAYRVHGIDSPRAWIEWIERQFADTRLLQFIGGGVLLAVLIIMWLAMTPTGLLGWLYIVGTSTLAVLSLSLIVATNHVRHIVVATAEAEDKWIRTTSTVITVMGLLWALAPWFL